VEVLANVVYSQSSISMLSTGKTRGQWSVVSGQWSVVSGQCKVTPWNNRGKLVLHILFVHLWYVVRNNKGPYHYAKTPYRLLWHKAECPWWWNNIQHQSSQSTSYLIVRGLAQHERHWKLSVRWVQMYFFPSLDQGYESDGSQT